MRREFSRKTRAQAFERSKGCCEVCSAKLKVGEGEVDHILPDALGGEPDLANARVLCRVCHKAKSADDIKVVRKADRQRDKHHQVFKPSARPFPGGKRSAWKKKMNGEVVPR